MRVRSIIIQIAASLGLIMAAVVAAMVLWDYGDYGVVPQYVDAELTLRSEGTTWTFTVDEPGAVMLVVDMPPDCKQDGSVSISPLYVAMRPDVVYEPSKEPEHVIPVPHGGLASTRVELKRAGAYVLRMEPIPMAMGNESAASKARVRILLAR